MGRNMSERSLSPGRKTRLVNTLGFREPELENTRLQVPCMICSDICDREPEDVETTLVNTLSFRKKRSHG
jgi:hypothetical protein